MNGIFDAAARSLLLALDPERAHALSLRALKSPLAPRCRVKPDPRLSTVVAGLPFLNPLGLAAGYDKNAEVAQPLSRLGFGFIEVGTVTPKPQAGNPRPRLFRLTADRAVINRMGFNNDGHAAALQRLRADRRGGIVGINIGANKDSPDRVADYVGGINTFYDVASYFTANVSSPNTPGLRDLQGRKALEALLEALLEAREKAAGIHGKRVPVFLKIAPDLDDKGLADIAQAAQSFPLDGLVVANTTLSRRTLKGAAAAQSGGMSGRPLFERSTIVLARMRLLVGPHMPLIGVGGIDSAETAAEKIRAGADLVQLYTALVYAGPGLPCRILKGLSQICDRENLSNLSALRDTRTEAWAARRLEG